MPLPHSFYSFVQVIEADLCNSSRIIPPSHRSIQKQYTFVDVAQIRGGKFGGFSLAFSGVFLYHSPMRL